MRDRDADPGEGLPLAPQRLRREWLTVGVIVSMLMLALVATRGTERLDNIIYDSALLAAPRPTPDSILIVAIDQESLARIGRWPWPRSIHARLIDRIAKAQPRAIIYDVLFNDAGEPASDDAALGTAIAAAGNVTLPVLFRVPGRDGQGYDALPPVPAIAAGAHLGHAAIHPDRDGVVRRVDLELDGLQRWRHIVVEALATPMREAPPPRQTLRRSDTVLVAFGGAPGHVRTVAFADVLDGRVPPDFLKDKFVLVGATAAGLGDQYSTPVTGDIGVMSGIEIQANLLDTLRTGAVVRPASTPAQAALALAAVWLLLTAYLILAPQRAALAGIALIAAVLAVSLLLLRIGQVWLPPATAIAGLITVMPLWAWRRLSAVNEYMHAELERLAHEPELFAAAVTPLAGGDPVARQIGLLTRTIARTRRLRQLVSAALHALPDATVLVGLDGKIVMANAAADGLFGPHGAPADIETCFAGDPALPAFAPPAFADPAAPWTAERVARDGSVREIRHVTWHDEDGTALGWIVRFGDITALRRAEARREEALQLLTHDMRSPQASILALLADAPAAPDLPARIAHYAQRTIALADGFLHLARAEAGGEARTIVDLGAILTEAVDDVWPQASRAGISIATSGADGETLVNGNAGLLSRSIGNLLGNALKYSPPGSRIECALRVCGTDAVLQVRDQGEGMAPDEVARLFRRFATNVQQGTGRDGVGLGLAFVQAVVSGHGGRIVCRSTRHVGTVFEITLPLHPPGTNPAGA